MTTTEREEEAAVGREEGGMEGEDQVAVEQAEAVIKVRREGGREEGREEEEEWLCQHAVSKSA